MSKDESSKQKELEYSKVPTNDNEKAKEATYIPLKYGYGIRHVQLVIFFFCMATSFMARGHLGVTIVAMTTKTLKDAEPYVNINRSVVKYSNGSFMDDVNENVTIVDANNSLGNNDGEEHWTIYRSYDWPKPIQEMVLTAFFLGYCLMMFPIALVCQRWGGKVPLQLSMLVNGVVSILTPYVALWGGWKAVAACRVIQGLSQSGTYPGAQTLLAQWVSASEKATLSGYVYAGTTFGNIIGFQLSGLIADAWGWPAVFWTIGFLCLLTFTLLTIFGASSPRYHKKISTAEKNYILGQYDSDVLQLQRKRAPWKAIITSKPVWGNIATHVGSGVSFVFFLNQVPSYIHYILGINVRSSGLLTSLPYVVSFFTSLGYGVISDYFTNRKIISIKNARRIFNTFSQVGVAISLICSSYASNTTVAIICFVVCMCCQMGLHSGWMVNHIDLSPNFSGTLMALGNTMMNSCVLILPVLVSNIVVDVTNVYQWRIMLYLVAAIAFIPNLIFVIFISADVQPWNDGYFVDAEKNNGEKHETTKKKEIEK